MTSQTTLASNTKSLIVVCEAMSLTLRARHKLLFKGRSNKYLGDVYTLSDSDHFKVSSELIVHSTVKYADYDDSKNKPFFYLSSPKDKEQNNEISKLYSFLEQNPTRALLLYFDSSGSSCLIGIPEQHETTLIGMRCLKCYIVDHKQPAPLQSTIGHKRQVEDITPAQSEQTIAASHYNDLVRDKATRHMSQIYHMRNLNNFLKTELINMAAETAAPVQNATNSRHSRDLNGVRVIDFGCGMGGDIFKWFKNPKGVQR